MSDANVDKVNKAPILQYIIIAVLILGIAAMGFMTVRKYVAKEPTVNPQEAQLKALTEMVTRDPNNLDARSKLAYAYQMLEQYDLAKEQYLEALKIFPDDMATHYNLGIIAKEEKNYPEAEKYLSKVLSLKPDHVLGAMAMGEIYLEKGEYDKVIEVTDSVLELVPGKTDLHMLKARAMEKQGDLKGAKLQYEEVLKFIPDDREAAEALAKIK